jgi:hypothetical protein
VDGVGHYSCDRLQKRNGSMKNSSRGRFAV